MNFLLILCVLFHLVGGLWPTSHRKWWLAPWASRRIGSTAMWKGLVEPSEGKQASLGSWQPWQLSPHGSEWVYEPVTQMGPLISDFLPSGPNNFKGFLGDTPDLFGGIANAASLWGHCTGTGQLTCLLAFQQSQQHRVGSVSHSCWVFSSTAKETRVSETDSLISLQYSSRHRQKPREMEGRTEGKVNIWMLPMWAFHY